MASAAFTWSVTFHGPVPVYVTPVTDTAEITAPVHDVSELAAEYTV